MQRTRGTCLHPRCGTKSGSASIGQSRVADHKAFSCALSDSARASTLWSSAAGSLKQGGCDFACKGAAAESAAELPPSAIREKRFMTSLHCCRDGKAMFDPFQITVRVTAITHAAVSSHRTRSNLSQ
jgi:hypothetical protein